MILNEMVHDLLLFARRLLLSFLFFCLLGLFLCRDNGVHIARMPRAVADAARAVRLRRGLERADERLLPAERHLDVGLTSQLEDGERVGRDLPRLDPRLQPLGGAQGSVDRPTFTSAFTGALCALRAGARNRPLGCP